MKSRAEWNVLDDDNVEFLRVMLEENARQSSISKKITHKEICQAASISEERFSRWFSGISPSRPFDRDQWVKIISRLIEAGLISLRATEESFPEYDGISSFFNQEESAFRKFRERLEGLYTGYRYSNSDLGKILQGNLTITFNAADKIITTREFYRTKNRSWRRSGYLFLRDDGGMIIMSRKSQSNEPQFQLLSQVFTDPDTGQITSIDGMIFDFQARVLYWTPVYLTRSSAFNEKQAERMAIALEPANVDDDVRKRLENRMMWKWDNALMYFAEPRNEKTRKKKT